MAKTAEAEPIKGQTVKCVGRRSLLVWRPPEGGYAQELRRGETAEVPRAIALQWQCAGWVDFAADPAPAPTKAEARAAAERAFVLLEDERQGRGLSESKAAELPALRRGYERVAQAIGADSIQGKAV